MVKRVVMFTVCLMFVLGAVCGAEPVAKDVLNNYKDIKYSFEAGLSYREFIDLYRKANLSFRRYEDENRNNSDVAKILAELKNVDSLYNYIGYLWRNKIESESMLVTLPEEIREAYPNLKTLQDVRSNPGYYYIWQVFPIVTKYQEVYIDRAQELLE